MTVARKPRLGFETTLFVLLHRTVTLCLYHVRLGRELVRLQTLQRHPLDGQLDSALVVDAVVLLVVDVSGQAEVGYFDGVALVQPVRSKHIEAFPSDLMTVLFLCLNQKEPFLQPVPSSRMSML